MLRKTGAAIAAYSLCKKNKKSKNHGVDKAAAAAAAEFKIWAIVTPS